MAMGFSSPNPFPFVSIRIKPLVSLSNRSRHNQKVAARPARILLTRRVLEFQRHMDFVHVLLADLERFQTRETPCPYRDAAPLLALRLPSIERSVFPVALSPTRSPPPASPARRHSRAPREKRTRPRHARHAVALRAHPDKIPSFPPVVQHRTRQSQSFPRHLSAAGKHIPRRSSA